MNSTNAWTFLTKTRCAALMTMLLLTAASNAMVEAATITLSNSPNPCTFAKAVASINSRSTQSPCIASGAYGSNDTIVVPNNPNNNIYPIATPITITRSMTIHGAGKYTIYLQATANFLGCEYGDCAVIHVTNPGAVVKMDNLTLDSGVANSNAGIYVEGADDPNLNDNNLELSFVVVSSFGETGLLNFGGRVLIQNSLIYLNEGSFDGGGVQNVNGINANGTWAVAKFVAKNSAISFNTANQGAGVWSNGKLDLESTLLQQNFSTDEGGAIYVTAVAGVPGVSCKVGNIAGSPPSELDDNTAGNAWSIMSSTIACSMSGSIGSGNSSPFCSPLVTGCPQ